MDTNNEQRRWGATGVRSVSYPGISDNGWQNIVKELEIEKLPGDGWNLFRAGLDRAMQQYYFSVDIENSSSPAESRNRIAELLVAFESAQTLLVRSSASNVSQLINEADEECDFNDCINSNRQLIDQLKAAEKLAKQYQPAGKLPRNSKYFMAAELAYSMKEYLKVEPKQTGHGLYVKLLECLVVEVTGKQPKSVMNVARNGLQVKRIDQGGCISWELDRII